ncbi:MAG: tyrosine-type recombinase/integrase [Lachnospiraceae bacterium]|nr:tyrosine-type recombinase/integrase [Lachnospiraceae bacterium]
MAKQSDFSYHLTNYLTTYLSGSKNFSIHTVWSYRDTFKLFLTYCDEMLRISPEKLRIQMITPKLVSDFLKWLKDNRGNSVASTNQRLAAIHAFFKYLQFREPQFLLQCQQILAIEPAKVSKPMVGFLTENELYSVFDQIDESTAAGRRDATLLRLLYDSAARVQELCDLRVRDVFLDGEPHVLLKGKGNKSRYVLIVKDVATRISAYITENHLNRPECMDMPLFFNQQRKKLTRAGVSYIVAKYADAARIKSPLIPKKITPHIFRHTKAMHLCQAGIDMIFIRDTLGHTDLATTEIYAKLNIELMRDALEKAYPELPSHGLPDWKEDHSLMNFLNSL